MGDCESGYDEGEDLRLDVWVEMGQVKLSAQFLPVDGLDIRRGEGWVDIVEWRRGMLSFAEDSAAVDIVQERIKLVRLVRESAIVVEDVVGSLSFLRLGSDADGRRPGGRR